MANLVSVIVAAYNIENYIDKCIESIIGQTYSELEILVVNDGSKDNTLSHAEKYQSSDKRVKVLDKKNGGLSDARNYGIDNCTGDYIVFVDGDDYLAPDMIEKLYKSLKENDADMCICNIQNINEKGELLDSPQNDLMKTGLHSSREMLDLISDVPNWFWVVAWNKLYKKDIFKTLRFSKGKIHEDEFLIHRALAECKTIQIIPDRLYFYVQRGSSITHVEYKISRLDGVEAFLDRADFYAEIGSYENSYKMLKKSRILFIDGYIALMNKKTEESRNRFRDLHMKYREIYRKVSKYIAIRDTLLWLLDKSMILAVYLSGNYRHRGR